jgi:hypothetical protein
MKLLAPVVIGLALLGLHFSACSSVGNGLKVVEPGDLDKSARQDLWIRVEGAPAALGTVVAPRKSPQSYSIEIKASHKMDVVFIESCHRHWVEYDKGSSYTFQYTPNAAMETGICPLKISTLEKDGRRKQYATVVFQNPSFALVADLRCNGFKVSPIGVSFCQSKAGKVQEIHFPEPVRMFSDSTSATCPLPKGIEGKDFELELPKGDCSYGFSTLAAPHKRMLLVTYGYDSDEYPEAL